MPKLYLVTSPSVSNSSFLPIYCPGTHILFFSSSPLTENKKKTIVVIRRTEQKKYVLPGFCAFGWHKGIGGAKQMVCFAGAHWDRDRDEAGINGGGWRG
jgi:hypothetical protein